MNMVFKYCPPERIDILENLKIRLTQPVCFNDPFEAFAIVKGGFESLPNQEAQKAYDDFQGRKILMNIQDNPEKALIERRHWGLNQIRKIGLNQMGVISLSSKYDDPLMWGRYADNARGFVLGLLPAFNITYDKAMTVCFPESVTYQETPPIIDLDPFFEGDKFYIENAFAKNHLSLLCTKSHKWNHESELRLISPLPSEHTSINDNGYPVHLISLLEPQILAIISGPTSSKKLNEQLKSYARNYNAPFYKMFKANNTYSYGLWGENEFDFKIANFGDKNNITYNHPSEESLK